GNEGKPLGEAVRAATVRAWLGQAGVTNLLGGAVAARQLPPPEPPPIKDPDDPQRGRWGGQSPRNGRKLTATVTDSSRQSYFLCDFTVASTDGSVLEGPVVFHLHDSYPRCIIQIRKIREGKYATLEEVTATGVYTVGAQVKDAAGTWIGLE